MCLSRLAARACGSWCRLVDRRTSEKIVGIAVPGSDMKGDAMWHMPHHPPSLEVFQKNRGPLCWSETWSDQASCWYAHNVFCRAQAVLLVKEVQEVQEVQEAQEVRVVQELQEVQACVLQCILRQGVAEHHSQRNMASLFPRWCCRSCRCLIGWWSISLIMWQHRRAPCSYLVVLFCSFFWGRFYCMTQVPDPVDIFYI